MSTRQSPSAGRPYGVERVCRAWRVPRSTVYRQLALQSRPRRLGKKGPKTTPTDEGLVELIRGLLEAVECDLGIRGEGYRKVWARLRYQGVFVSKGRVLRLMRENSLLAPVRSRRPRGPRVHDGTVLTGRPNAMWGTDGTRAWTRHDGWVWVFIAVDHCTGECVGIHAAPYGTRFEALEPIHQAVRERFGALGPGVVSGLLLRHDHGTQYMSAHFQAELAFLGIKSSPSFIASPEGNGVAERFIRTLKEQFLWVEAYDTVEGLRNALTAFRRRFNQSWLVARHGYRTPEAVRHAYELEAGLAA